MAIADLFGKKTKTKSTRTSVKGRGRRKKSEPGPPKGNDLTKMGADVVAFGEEAKRKRKASNPCKVQPAKKRGSIAAAGVAGDMKKLVDEGLPPGLREEQSCGQGKFGLAEGCEPIRDQNGDELLPECGHKGCDEHKEEHGPTEERNDSGAGEGDTGSKEPTDQDDDNPDAEQAVDPRTETFQPDLTFPAELLQEAIRRLQRVYASEFWVQEDILATALTHTVHQAVRSLKIHIERRGAGGPTE